jgi:hypothetical protein
MKNFVSKRSCFRTFFPVFFTLSYFGYVGPSRTEKYNFSSNTFLFLDVVSIRNVKAATTNPFKELNTCFTKIWDGAVKNRPFTEWSKTTNLFRVELVLLPGQYLLIPSKIYKLLNFKKADDLTMWTFDQIK